MLLTLLTLTRGSNGFKRIQKGIYEFKKEEFDISQNTYLNDFLQGKHTTSEHDIMEKLLGQNEVLKGELETFKNEIMGSLDSYASNSKYNSLNYRIKTMQYPLPPDITDKTVRFLRDIKEGNLKDKSSEVKK